MQSLSHVDFKLLLCLNALLAHNNVSRAADEMNMSQPAMSRALAKLRLLFNDQLFVRTSHGMEPTTRAVSLLQPLQGTLDQLNRLLISENFSPLLCQRTFKIHMSSYSSQAHISNLAKLFYQQAPNAQLEIIDIKGKPLQQQSSQVIDLALGSQMTHVPDYFHQLYLGEEEMQCFMRADHPLADQDLTLDKFLDYPHVVVSLGGGPSMPIENQLNAIGKSRKVGFRSPHYLNALEVISSTQMLFNTSPIVPLRFQKQFNLIGKKLPFDHPPSRYYLNWPPTLHKDPAHIWLRNLCSTVIKNNMMLAKP